ncbi:MAG: hypothetical protein AAGD11_11045 [Planctomycetota bacterium]
MKKVTLAAVLSTMFALVAMQPNAAHANAAWGISIGTRNVQLDVGNPYAYPQYYTASRQPTYRRAYSNPRWYGYENYAAYDRRDARYYRGVPGRFVPPAGNCDYAAGRYDRSYRGPRDQSWDPRWDVYRDRDLRPRRR